MIDRFPTRVTTFLRVFLTYALAAAFSSVLLASLGNGWLSIVQNDLRIVCAFLLAAVAIIVFFRSIRLICAIFNARRLEVFFAAALGVAFAWGVLRLFHKTQLEQAHGYLKTVVGFLTSHADSTGASIVAFVVAGSASVVCVLILVGLLRVLRKNEAKGGFLSDNPISADEPDILGFSDAATRFARQVVEQPVNESIVFGIDAPWGTGKSSFLNLARKHLSDNKETKVIVVNFEPLTFESEADLLKKFISDFISTLKEDYYIPEIESELEKYSKLLHATGLTIGGVELNVPFQEHLSLEETLNRLKGNIGAFVSKKRKILVVIDDLDRLAIDKVKLMMNIVKKSFVLPGVSYVICYDTSNFNAFEAELRKTETLYMTEPEAGSHLDIARQGGMAASTLATTPLRLVSATSTEDLDNRKVIEYFEKVVNVKIDLYFSMSKLGDYVAQEIDRVVSTEALKGHNLSGVVELFKTLFEPASASKYAPYLGDLRKVKRFLNVVKMLGAFDFEATQYDYDAHDLVHLILIYINYPKIFRKIYQEEASPGNNFFSVDLETASRQSVIVNSRRYKKYIQSLNPDEAFLVSAVFGVEQRFSERAYERITHLERASCAAFNSNIFLNSNLESYLQLIVHARVGERAKQYKFHLEKVRGYLNSGVVQHAGEYAADKGEGPRYTFIETLLKNMDLVGYEEALRTIDELINDLPKYSSLELAPYCLNARKRFVFRLLNLLNERGWVDEDGHFQNNSNGANLAPIAKRIFGEDGRTGILAQLSASERGLLGIHDMLIFRLGCCQDRSGSLHDVYASLGLHADPTASRDGNISQLTIQQMREISQHCFAIFQERYIDEQVNIFDQGINLSSQEMIGQCAADTPSLGEEKRLSKGRSLTSIIIYELGNSVLDTGVGCGRYDITGKEDNGGIKVAMDEYLRKCCFNPSIAPLNAEHFVDYLFIHYTDIDDEYVPKVESFVAVISRENLSAFWREHGPTIKMLLQGKEKTIITHNYTVKYEEELPRLYELLDREL